MPLIFTGIILDCFPPQNWIWLKQVSSGGVLRNYFQKWSTAYFSLRVTDLFLNYFSLDLYQIEWSPLKENLWQVVEQILYGLDAIPVAIK